jgi:F-type H+-transporting ATPase subunit epsilon
MPFRCVIVTPEQQVLDEALTQAILPAHDGLVGILTDRAPLLAKLGQGPLRVDLAGGQTRHFYVEGGIAQMKDNRLTILTNQATPASEIDAEAARAEYAEAVARKVTDRHTVEDRERELARARAKQQLAASSSR